MKTMYSFYRKQSGISLFVVMIGLLSLSLAAIAIIRTVDTGALIVGNMSFRSAAVSAANRAVETTALTWIKNHSASLDNNTVEDGYYASELWGIDATGNCVDSANPDCSTSAKIAWNWENDATCGNCVANGTCSICLRPSSKASVDGYESRFLIVQQQGTATADPKDRQKPSAPPVSTGGESQSKGAVAYGGGTLSTSQVPFFRIFVRTSGPRNTVIFTEQYVHF